MAHGDYNCCAICDRKLDYNAWNARTKEEICTDCLVKLRDIGLSIITVQELIHWIETEEVEKLRDALKRLQFKPCLYNNPVDEACIKRGVPLKR